MSYNNGSNKRLRIVNRSTAMISIIVAVLLPELGESFAFPTSGDWDRKRH